jgi:hypothetical protein
MSLQYHFSGTNARTDTETVMRAFRGILWKKSGKLSKSGRRIGLCGAFIGDSAIQNRCFSCRTRENNRKFKFLWKSEGSFFGDRLWKRGENSLCGNLKTGNATHCVQSFPQEGGR